MNIAVIVLIIVVYDLIGLVVWTGKYPFLIAGYLTTPKEKRKTYNWKALGKFLAILFWVSSIGLAIMLLQDGYIEVYPQYLGQAIFLGTLLLGIIYANISKRFRI